MNARTTLVAPRTRSAKEIILDSKPFAEENRTKSWYHMLSTLALLLLALAGTFLPLPWVVRLVFSLLSGLLMVRFFVIYHDYLHKAILQDSAIANAIMTLYGLFILAPTTIWSRTHDHHHHHNSKLSNRGIGSYPLVSRQKFYELTKLQQRIYLASRHPLTILFGYFSIFLFDLNLKSIFQSPRKHLDCLLAVVIHFSIGAFLFSVGGWATLLFSWLLPFLLAHGMGAYLFYAQHNFPSAIYQENEGWTYIGAALESTSLLKTNRLMEWFTANIGYHHVHHLNHRIPFYRLQEAMQAIPELHHPKTTSLHPKEVWACLRLKVWDVDQQKMTPL